MTEEAARLPFVELMTKKKRYRQHSMLGRGGGFRRAAFGSVILPFTPPTP